MVVLPPGDEEPCRHLPRADKAASQTNVHSIINFVEELGASEPVYHRLSDRIRAHVLLCWLALLLVRVAENETSKTWRGLRSDLGRLMVGIHQSEHGEIWQTGKPSTEQQASYAAVKLQPPPRNYAIPAPRAAPGDL